MPQWLEFCVSAYSINYEMTTLLAFLWYKKTLFLLQPWMSCWRFWPAFIFAESSLMSPCSTGEINSSDISAIAEAVWGHRVKKVLINCCKYVMAADRQRTMLLMAALLVNYSSYYRNFTITTYFFCKPFKVFSKNKIIFELEPYGF